MKIISANAAHETVTSRTPNAWAVGRGDETQSTTFRALAWSQEEDIVSEPLPYIGEPYEEFQEPTAEAVEPTPVHPQRRSTLLYGIAAGIAAAAIGGLAITVMNTDDGPVTVSTKVTQPATNAVNSQPSVETMPFGSSSPAPVETAAAPVQAAPAHAVSSAVAPSHALITPAPELQSTVTSEAVTPEAVAREAATPEAAASEPAVPAASTPQFTPPAATPKFTPPGTKSPVWVPPVTPQPVPHPVVPPTFHVPAADPVIPVPASSNPVIPFKPGVTIPTIIPTLLPLAGQ